MSESKVQRLIERARELEDVLSQSDVLADQKKYLELTREHAYVSNVQSTWEQLKKKQAELEEALELCGDESDLDLHETAVEEADLLKKEIESLEASLQELLVPPDPNDHRNCIIELRAGTGGDEAALFVGDCVRMYKYFADSNKWRCEELSCVPSERGGFKEYVMAFSGSNVYRLMKYEAGTHRVQRIPETEAQGRVHTSAITVAVLMEPEESEEIKLEEKDLRVDTYRASGAGGQHVNTTDSAVRITHIPSGTVAYCSEEKSQQQNRIKAMRLLQAKIADEERLKKEREEAQTRAEQVGSGDRSERIRTYNFPQNRVTEHRTQMTRYNLDRFMEGDLNEIVRGLLAHFLSSDL